MRSRSVNILNLISKQISNKHLLVSFSGGQDSLTLLILLFVIQSQNFLKLNILWNNHLWHKDSFFIARHVLKLGYLLKLSAHNVITVTSVQTELQARQWRLKASRRLQIFYEYHNIVQAHSGTDKIETLLLNLFRGTGNTCPFYSTNILLNFSQNQKRKIKYVNLVTFNEINTYVPSHRLRRSPSLPLLTPNTPSGVKVIAVAEGVGNTFTPEGVCVGTYGCEGGASSMHATLYLNLSQSIFNYKWCRLKAVIDFWCT